MHAQAWLPRLGRTSGGAPLARRRSGAALVQLCLVVVICKPDAVEGQHHHGLHSN